MDACLAGDGLLLYAIPPLTVLRGDGSARVYIASRYSIHAFPLRFVHDAHRMNGCRGTSVTTLLTGRPPDRTLFMTNTSLVSLRI